ncbi:hypothetical protein [Halorussus caseinilyticus]|uniref:DUF5518 domain-containing protein n=1 Tax=Halorussus caseinilyticus TaxID=3034025 RepID=A0ABD5WJJ5_9EURY|nr:hypothetical protein [Halorussus sp. DT72]
MVGFLNFVIGFVVSLLIGAFGIYVGARVIADRDDYEYAILTALVGAFVWWLVAGLFSIIPIVGGLIGSVLGLLAWVYVINARYPGGWGNAVGIALVAYLTVWVVLVLLNSVGLLASGALGVPGL